MGEADVSGEAAAGAEGGACPRGRVRAPQQWQGGETGRDRGGAPSPPPPHPARNGAPPTDPPYQGGGQKTHPGTMKNAFEKTQKTQKNNAKKLFFYTREKVPLIERSTWVGFKKFFMIGNTESYLHHMKH
jgi:hypothetical protein